jgi:LPXTG-site transpeptidase (sortase) family protein
MAATLVGTPVRLVIPSIKVNAVVEQVGLTPTKAVEVPQGHGHVAWYKLGARPGDPGTAVIDGHFARKTSGWAVFNDLYKLRPGDAVSIKDNKGKVTRFVVTSSRVYDVNARPSEVYFSNDGSHLNLVTCAGSWINALNGFNKRLVVFTDLVN